MNQKKETKTYRSHSESDTEHIGAEIARAVGPGTVIALRGNLGAGKTVFTRGVARGLGYGGIICSPTFNLVKEYSTGSSSWLFHLDLYRINDAAAAIAFGIEEYINNDNAITVIEWPERIEAILPENTVSVCIERLNDDERLIVVRQGKC